MKLLSEEKKTKEKMFLWVSTEAEEELHRDKQEENYTLNKELLLHGFSKSSGNQSPFEQACVLHYLTENNELATDAEKASLKFS